MKKIVSFFVCVALMFAGLCVTVPAEDVTTTTGFTLERVPANDEIVYVLYLDDAAAIEITGITADIDYPDSLELVKAKYIYEDGLCTFSRNLTDKPFRMAALIGTGVYPSGVKLPLARFTFAVKEGCMLEDELNIGLNIGEAIDLDGNDHKDVVEKEGEVFVPANEIKSVSVKELPAVTEYEQHTEQYDETAGGTLLVTYWDGSEKDVPFSECILSGFDASNLGANTITVEYEKFATTFDLTIVPIHGDVNYDGKIGLADASNILKYIAAWDIEIDTALADVTGDGAVNSSDVSLMLKFIADWDVSFVKA